jgi:hypothetical protein
MQPASHGDNPAAPAYRITPKRVDLAAFDSVHALAAAVDAYAARGLPTQTEGPERRAVVNAAHAVGEDMRAAFERALDDAARDVDAAHAALEDARERLERAIREARETREAVRRAEREGVVPAVPALGDCNTRRWHPVDGWQDGNEPPAVNSPLALDAALYDAEMFVGGDVSAREVQRAAALALEREDDRGA